MLASKQICASLGIKPEEERIASGSQRDAGLRMTA